jgi:CheY-like chemotaxis protein
MGRSGTGLGMSVVWGTVQDHNGYIHVDSSPGNGTEFQLYFPATRRDHPDEKEPESVQGYTGNGETILVIDDVKEQRIIAQIILERLNYNVKTVSSGEKAIEFMTNHSSDLLLLDMIMDPGIDGLETYMKILQLHPGQKAVVASGFSDNGRVKQAQRLGAGEYVKKPYTFEKIGMAVKKELERKT